VTTFRGLVRRFGERLEATAPRSPYVPQAPPRIDAYHGYASATEAFVYGRLLSNAPVDGAGETDPWWRNLLNTYRRMETDETPGIRLRIELDGAHAEAVSDKEGHFRARLRLDAPLAADRPWRDAKVTLLPPPGTGWPEVTALAPVLVASPAADHAVISDVDDTVIETHATRPLRMMRTVLFENARTRRPFPGVAAFYSRLERGVDGKGPNPLFYLSSSPWNLHDVLVDFLVHNAIPLGPLLLKDWGLPERGTPRTTHREHKLARIEHLLRVFAGLRFILIGDNGQADPAIYEETAARHPDRILGVYIRALVENDRRKDALERVARSFADRAIPFLAFHDTDEAAAHAEANGFIG